MRWTMTETQTGVNIVLIPFPSGKGTRRGERTAHAGNLHESQNPHLPAAAPAGLLSREITGEVRFAALRIPGKKSSNRDPTSTQGKLRPASFLTLGAGVTPAARKRETRGGFRIQSSSFPHSLRWVLAHWRAVWFDCVFGAILDTTT
jgi:hypothetical protein